MTSSKLWILDEKSAITYFTFLNYFLKWDMFTKPALTVLCWSPLSTSPMFSWCNMTSLGHSTLMMLLPFLCLIVDDPLFMIIETFCRFFKSRYLVAAIPNMLSTSLLHSPLFTLLGSCRTSDLKHVHFYMQVPTALIFQLVNVKANSWGSVCLLPTSQCLKLFMSLSTPAFRIEFATTFWAVKKIHTWVSVYSRLIISLVYF